jgi:uncharacterized protein (TIRG00374 family)
MEDKTQINSLLTNKKTIISFIVSFLILYLLIKNIDIPELIRVAKNISLPLYIAAFGLHYLSFVVRGIRWKKLLSSLKIKISSSSAIEIVFLSWFVNSIVPAKIGDIYRSYLLKKENDEPISKTIGTIVVERILDIILLLFLLTLSGYLLYSEKIPEEINQSLKIGYTLIIILVSCIILAAILKERLMQMIPKRLHKYFENLGHGILRPVSDFETITYVLATSLMIWLLESGRLFFVTKALGIDIGIYTVVFIALASTLLTAIPLTPAGLGAVEFSIIFLLTLSGVDSTLGTAVAFLDRLISYWSVLLSGMIVYLLSKKT